MGFLFLGFIFFSDAKKWRVEILSLNPEFALAYGEYG